MQIEMTKQEVQLLYSAVKSYSDKNRFLFIRPYASGTEEEVEVGIKRAYLAIMDECDAMLRNLDTVLGDK